MKMYCQKSSRVKFQQVMLTSNALKKVKGGGDIIIIEEMTQGLNG